MKKQKSLKTKLLLGCLTAAAVLATTFASITYAKYVDSKKTKQSVFGLGGERETSIFFNANIWKQGKDSSGNIVDAVFYLYVWHTSNAAGTRTVIAPSAHVNPTIGSTVMDLYVFEYDPNTYNRMIFLRWNPEIEPSADLTYGDGHGKWNQTSDVTYSSTVNYYCIDAWGTGTPAQATPTTNYIYKNPSTGNLSWGYPS